MQEYKLIQQVTSGFSSFQGKGGHCICLEQAVLPPGYSRLCESLKEPEDKALNLQ